MARRFLRGSDPQYRCRGYGSRGAEAHATEIYDVMKCDGPYRFPFWSHEVTCFPVSGPIIAGKFQVSGCAIRAAGRGMTHEEIEVHRATDRLHSAAGCGGNRGR